MSDSSAPPSAPAVKASSKAPRLFRVLHSCVGTCMRDSIVTAEELQADSIKRLLDLGAIERVVDAPEA